jgi:hypothetical protein
MSTYIRKAKRSTKVNILRILKLIVFFIVEGTAGYVLPRFENRVYLEFTKGQHFGHSELGSSEIP